MKTKTPELNKMHSVKDHSQAIGEFLEWLQCEKGWELAFRHKHSQECLSHGAIVPPRIHKDRIYGSENLNRKYTDEKWLTCGCFEGQFLPANYSAEKLLAEHFKIDLNKVEDERRSLLDELRMANA